MNFEQYEGCVVTYNGRTALVTGSRSSYDGDFIRLRYTDGGGEFEAGAFERELLGALPDPADGLLKSTENGTAFLLDGNEYGLSSHPYEPCLYIKKDGETIRTLHNAFSADGLPERLADDGTLTGADGREYDLKSFCRVLAAALASGRAEMDFTYAAVLSRTAEERHDDYGTAYENTPHTAPAVMKFCPQCGSRNAGGKFCTECGTKLVRD